MGAKRTPFLKESLFKTDSEGGPKGRAEGRFLAKMEQQCMTNAHRMKTMIRKWARNSRQCTFLRRNGSKKDHVPEGILREGCLWRGSKRYENLPNPWIRENFDDGVSGKCSNLSSKIIQSQGKLVICMKIVKIDVSLVFTKKRGFFTKIFQICGFAQKGSLSEGILREGCLWRGSKRGALRVAL